MLASPQLQPETDPPKGAEIGLEKMVEAGSVHEPFLPSDSSGGASQAQLDIYVQLQQRIFLVTLVVSALAVLTTAIFLGLQTSMSVLIGALSGILYLRLLARSIGKLGKTSKTVGKIQLIVPVLLILAVSRLPQLEFLPAFLGFLLYKPSLIFQAMFES